MGERTWLTTAPDGSLHGLLSIRPDLGERYDAMIERLWHSGVDATLLELCRIRIAQLVGDAAGATLRTPQGLGPGSSEQRVGQLPDWRRQSSFSEAERAALTVAEQFVVDVHGVSDDQFAALVAHHGSAGAVALATAFGLFDGQSRFRLALSAPGVHGPLAEAAS
jgi:alkylhydroperoxidase family enzyme